MMINKEKHKKRIRTVISAINLLILCGIVIGMPVYLYFTNPELFARFGSLEEISSFLIRHKTESAFIFIGLQIFQSVVSLLPGQALQFAGGYVFPFWLGFLYSITGVALGTVITFYLARLLGKKSLYVIFGEEKFLRFENTLNSKRSFVVVFVIFLIPGLPKDLFCYAAGVSNIRILPFLCLSLIARTPAMLGSILMGMMFYDGNYIGLVILGAAAVILFIAGILKRDRLVQWTDRAYSRLFNSR